MNNGSKSLPIGNLVRKMGKILPLGNRLEPIYTRQKCFAWKQHSEFEPWRNYCLKSKTMKFDRHIEYSVFSFDKSKALFKSKHKHFYVCVRIQLGEILAHYRKKRKSVKIFGLNDAGVLFFHFFKTLLLTGWSSVLPHQEKLILILLTLQYLELLPKFPSPPHTNLFPLFNNKETFLSNIKNNGRGEHSETYFFKHSTLRGRMFLIANCVGLNNERF